MVWARVKAVIWRHFYNFKHSWDRLSDAFYWPAMDIFIWGLTSMYIREATVEIPNIVMLLMTGLVFWMIVWRGQYEITVNLLEEMWNSNLVNLFTTPLTVYEWMMGVVVLGIAKMIMTISFAGILVYLLYAVNVFRFGWLILPFMALLLMFGWSVGFIVAGLIIRFGMRIQTLAWTGIYLLAPFSAIYYPVSSLPAWAQTIAKWTPTSYVFEGMRSVIFTGTMDQANLIKSLGLTIIFFLSSIGFFLMMFNQSRKTGLARLE
ncbi:MAG: ABC transporter permease [Patescibacteria group bacterium]|nr:ABC transporter permease [Patescibacteria group bacterium]